MDIKYLKLVKTISEEGNISKSADRLCLTQSALSHQLREFEERLGVKIFVRSRNNWTLTQEGEEIRDLSHEVLSRIDRGLKRIGDIREGASGVIRLSTECYTFYHGLPAFIMKMKVLYPEIEVQLKLESTHYPVSKLLSNELDMCVVTTKPENHTVVVHDLFEDEVFAVIHPENILASKEYLVPEDFSNQHLIIHSYPLETVSVYAYFLKPAAVKPLKMTAIPLTEVTLELIDANMGIACFPKWALRSFKNLDSFKLIPLGKEGLKRNHYLVHRKEDSDKKYILDFVHHIFDESPLG